MSERSYLQVILVLPALVFAALASWATAAGCYAVTMNCFSIISPQSAVTRAMFFAAQFLPFGGPPYLAIAGAGLALLSRGGERALERWLWLVPFAYAALVHASCVAFAGAALPHRRLSPDLHFDALVAAAGFGYLGVTRLARPAFAPKRRQGR